MATNNLSAQQAFLNQLKKGRLTQSQIEAGQRYADNNMTGYNFDPKVGYYKGTKPSSSPSSSQRSAQRSSQSASTGNTISKGGAAGFAAMGEMDPLMLSNAFNPGSVSQAQKDAAGWVDFTPNKFDNVPSGGVFDMVAEGRDPNKKYFSDGTYAGQILSTTVPSDVVVGQTSVTSGLEGLSMVEKDRLSSQGQLGSYMNQGDNSQKYQALTPQSFDNIYSNPKLANASSFQSGPQMGSPFDNGGSIGRSPSTVGFRANGGPVKANQPYVVGEDGPEVIYPSEDGNVLSNEMLQIAREFGIDPTNLSEDDLYQLLSVQSAKVPTQDGTMIGVPDFNAPYIYPAANQAFGDVQVNMPSNLLDPNAPIKAAQDRLPSTPKEVIPRGGIRTRGTGGEQNQIALDRTGGAGGTQEAKIYGAIKDLAKEVIFPSAEQISANLAANSRTGGVQTLPPAMAATPAVEIATPESAATVVEKPSIFTETPVVQSPNTQTRESVTATGIGRLGLDPSVTGNGVGMVNPLTGEPLPFIQGVNGTMNQQALLPEGLTASSPIPEGLVKAIGSDGRMILTSPAEAARLNAIESQTQKDDRAAQQKFLASDKAREFSNRQIRSSIMGDGQYGRDSAAREQRQAARPDFFEAQTRAVGTVTDRERRAARGEGMSDADRRDIAKANIRGASASDIARAMKVAELNNVDLQTGKSLDKKDTRRPDEVERDRLNLLRTQQIIEDGNKPDATKYEKDASARQLAVGKGIINQAQADDANKRDLIGNPPSIYDSWAEYEAKTGIDQDKDGKVSTKEDAKAARLSKVELSRLQELLNKDKK